MSELLEPANAPVSRVTESCLQSTLIPGGEEEVVPPRSFVRKAGGECDTYIIPRDKLGPGLTSIEKPTRNMRLAQESSCTGRSQLQHTRFGIMVSGQEEVELDKLPQRIPSVGDGQYVRMVGRS